MWSYYGAKTNIIDYYPAPKFDKIIEPFAGTARYSLKYFDRDILLIDKYDVIVKIWKWMQKCSPSDILKLPRFIKKEQNINDFNFDCDEAKYLFGFLLKKGVERPQKKSTKWVYEMRPNFINYSLKRISSNLFKIKHWKIELDDYKNVKNENATWFIDPPYQFGGHAYVESNKKIDYKYLHNWTLERYGQIIVCENMKADWLDFIPMINQYVRKGKYLEAIYSNYQTEYDNLQLTLF